MTGNPEYPVLREAFLMLTTHTLPEAIAGTERLAMTVQTRNSENSMGLDATDGNGEARMSTTPQDLVEKAMRWCLSAPPGQLNVIPDDIPDEVRLAEERVWEQCNKMHQSAIRPKLVVAVEDAEASRPGSTGEQTSSMWLASGPKATEGSSSQAESSSPRGPSLEDVGSRSEDALSPSSRRKSASKDSPASSAKSSDVDTGYSSGKESVRVHRGIEDASKLMNRLFHSPHLSHALRRGSDVLVSTHKLFPHGSPFTSKTVECSSCFDEIPTKKAVHLACQHDYCETCLLGLVTTATRTETLWPPRCCLIELPREMIRQHLPASKLRSFNATTAEFDTPASERWYCPYSPCAKFFPAHVPPGQETVSCPRCHNAICVQCRKLQHTPGTRCTEAEQLAAPEA